MLFVNVLFSEIMEERMENDKKTDRRVLYTKMFLRESLLTLLKEKPIAKITPSELCRHAKMNRNTFYAHYNSPEELLKSIEDEFYKAVQLSLERSLNVGSISELMTEICQAIADHRDLCSILFTEFGDKDFLKRIVDLAHDKTITEWAAAGVYNDNEQVEMLYCFSVSGSVSVIQKWIADGMKSTPAEIACFIEKVSNNGLFGFIGKP